MNRQDPDNGKPAHRTGMGRRGTVPTDGRHRARDAMGERLEEAAWRVRQLGDRVAERNPVLASTRPLAYDAARGIDSAAEYLRNRELGAMRRDLERQVRRHPLMAVGVAFLAGYAIRRIFW